MTTLVIVPHLDDESLSCGALIRNRCISGWGATVLPIFSRKYYGEDETVSLHSELEDFREACRTLGAKNLPDFLFPEGEPYKVGYYDILRKVEKALDTVCPTEVVIPYEGDLNQDHRHLADVCKIALRPANLKNVDRVLQSVAFDSDLVRPNYYVAFDKSVLQCKLQAIACYRRESRIGVHPRSPKNIEAMHRVLGAQAGAEFAEGYHLYLQRE